MKSLLIKVSIPINEWINKYYKSFHNTLFKEGIQLGKILNIDKINNTIEFELINVDLNKIQQVFNTSSNLTDLSIAPTAVMLTMGALITTYLIVKGLTKQFKIITAEVKDLTKPIFNPINLLLIGGIIFLLSGGLKLFKKS